MQDVIITRLSPEDALSLSELLNRDDTHYEKYFFPFPKDKESLETRLRSAVKDRYWGLVFREILAGFFMLRGFDEGYNRPSFGVYIAKEFSNRGLLKLTLEYSTSWCRLNNINAIMLKVHPDNKHALECYKKAGFGFIESCPQTGHSVMEKQLSRNR